MEEKEELTGEAAETTTEDAPTEQIQEEKPSRLRGYAKEKYPDQQFESDDDIAEALITNSTELEGKYSKAQEVTKKLIAIFEAYPEVRGMIGDIIMGAKPRAAIAKYFTPEDLTPQPGDDDEEEWKKNVTERDSKVANEQKFRDDLASNYEASEKDWDAFVSESGLSEEDANKFVEWANNILNDIFSGKISKEVLSQLMKAWRRDEDVTDAENIGYLKGKSEQIKAKKDIVKKSNDNLPKFNGSGEAKPKPVQPKSYFGNLADKINDNKIL